MSDDSIQFLLQILAVFTAVAALAMAVQALLLFGIFKAMREIRDRSSEFLTKWEPLADTANKTLGEVRTQSKQILTHVQEIAASSKNQVGKFDGLVDDFSGTARKQMARVDEMMSLSLDHLQRTGDEYQRALMEPARQLRGVSAAASAILDHLFGRRRSTVDRATQDEEMFI